jgi:hypothetical protein
MTTELKWSGRIRKVDRTCGKRTASKKAVAKCPMNNPVQCLDAESH